MILTVWLESKSECGLKECKKYSFRDLEPSQNIKFSFSLYCCVTPTQMKKCVNFCQYWMMGKPKNRLFNFLTRDPFEIFNFELSLIKERVITQEPKVLFTSNLDQIFSVSIGPCGHKIRGILGELGGTIKTLLKNDLKQVKNNYLKCMF